MSCGLYRMMPFMSIIGYLTGRPWFFAMVLISVAMGLPEGMTYSLRRVCCARAWQSFRYFEFFGLHVGHPSKSTYMASLLMRVSMVIGMLLLSLR